MEKLEIDEYCRFCLKELDETDENTLINDEIINKFKDITGIEIEMSLGYSNIICEPCNQELYKFCNYKHNLIKNQIQLQYRESSSVASDNEDDKNHNSSSTSKTNNSKDPIKVDRTGPTEAKLEIKMEPEFMCLDIETESNENDCFYNERSLLFESLFDGGGRKRKRRKLSKDNLEMKTIQCQYCDRHFPDNFKLNRHTKSHLGIKDYECKDCDKKYFRQEALNRHYRTAHLNIRFHCELPGCSAQYARKETYRNHVISQHSHLNVEEMNKVLDNIRKIPLPKMESVNKNRSSSSDP